MKSFFRLDIPSLLLFIFRSFLSWKNSIILLPQQNLKGICADGCGLYFSLFLSFHSLQLTLNFQQNFAETGFEPRTFGGSGYGTTLPNRTTTAQYVFPKHCFNTTVSILSWIVKNDEKCLLTLSLSKHEKKFSFDRLQSSSQSFSHQKGFLFKVAVTWLTTLKATTKWDSWNGLLLAPPVELLWKYIFVNQVSSYTFS